jgi:hypothetical protein
LGIEGTCTGIVSEFVPAVVDKFNGFEGVVSSEVLGDVIPTVRSIPLDSSFYMSRKVIVGSTGNGGSLVVWGKGDL